MNLPQDIGIKIPDILLPKADIDPHKWAVIACDQFTSEPEYWQEVAEIVGDSPSTYHMILPEVYLETPEEDKRLASTQEAMRQYLKAGLFQQVDDLIYVLREVDAITARG